MKATHTGTCQCCGATQKLPGGTLAKHGYNVTWGYFNGVCQGAGHLPFEQDYSLIQTFVRYAGERLANLKTEQETLRKPAETPTAWVHQYRNGGFKTKSAYFWGQVEVICRLHTLPDGHTFNTFHYVKGEREEKLGFYPDYSKGEAAPANALEAATLLNMKRAESLEETVKGVQSYIAWQAGRITSWKPGVLTPIPAE